MQKPCPLEHFLAPNKVNWSVYGRGAEAAPLCRSVNLWQVNTNELKRAIASLDLVRDFHAAAKLIVLRTNRNFLPAMAANERLRPRLAQLGLVADDLRQFNESSANKLK